MESVIWFLLLSFNFEPPYFKELADVDKIYVLGRFGAAYILLILLIMKCRSYRPGKFALSILALESCLFFSTFYNNSYSMLTLGLNEFTTISFVFFLDYMFSSDIEKAISVLTLHYEILVYGNLVTVFLFPAGMYNLGTGRGYWLLGQVNQIILYVLPAMILELLYSRYVKKKRYPEIRTWMLITTGIVTAIVVWSATALVGIAVFVGMVLIGCTAGIYMDLKYGILASAIIFAAFVIFRVQDIFAYFIVDILHRNLTFSTRTEVWDRALACIQQKMILGYGVETSEQAIKHFGYLTPHNRYLYLWYQGGIVMLGMFVRVLLNGAKTLRSASGSKAVIYTGAGLFALLVMMQFESYNATVFYVPLALMFYSASLEAEEKGNDLKV